MPEDNEATSTAEAAVEDVVDETSAEENLGELIKLIVAGNPEDVENFLLERKPDLNVCVPGAGGTPLHKAVRLRLPDIVKLLINNGADVSTRNNDGLTPVMVAAKSKKQHSTVMQALLEKEVNVNDIDTSEDGQGNTPLLWATIHGHLSYVQSLLGVGASIRAVNHKGRTVFHEAAARGREKCLAEAVNRHIALEADRLAAESKAKADAEKKARIEKRATAKRLKEQKEQAEKAAKEEVEIGKAEGAQDDGASEATEDKPGDASEKEGDDGAEKPTKSAESEGGAKEEPTTEAASAEDTQEQPKADEAANDEGTSKTEASAEESIAKDAGAGFEEKADDEAEEESNSVPDTERVLDAIDKDGNSALQVAMSTDVVGLMGELIRGGCSVADCCVDGEKNPLHLVFKSLGESEEGDAAEKLKADVQAMLKSPQLELLMSSKDEDGFTPAHMAVSQSFLSPIAVLLEGGVDLTLAGQKDSKSLLHAAIDKGEEEIVKLLAPVQGLKEAKQERYDGGLTPLHYAVQYEKEGLATVLLESGCDPLGRNPKGETVLHVAVAKGTAMQSFIKVLLKKKVKDVVNAVDKRGRTALHVAARKGFTTFVTDLLDKPANAASDVVDEDGCTALHCAAISGERPCVEALSAKKGLIDAQTKNGQTPLLLATRYGNQDAVEALIVKKANVTLYDHYGWTAVHTAAAFQHDDLLQYLINRETPVKKRDLTGWSALHISAGEGRLTACKSLVEADAPLNSRDNRRRTPLHIACYEGHLDVVEYLLEKGANHRAVTSLDETPLLVACSRDHPAVCKMLIEWDDKVISEKQEARRIQEEEDARLEEEKAAAAEARTEEPPAEEPKVEEGNPEAPGEPEEPSADDERFWKKYVDIPNSTGQGPLHITCGKDYPELTSYLLSVGASLSAVDASGQSPLLAAAACGSPAALKAVVEASRHAVEGEESDEAVNHVGQLFEAVDEKGQNALHLGVLSGDLEVVKAIVALGHVQELELNGAAQSVLHLSARVGSVPLLSYLLEEVIADSQRSQVLGLQDNDGSTCLHSAAAEGQVEATKHLVKQGDCPSVETKDGKGLTALHCAVMRGPTGIHAGIELLKVGANVDEVDGEGISAHDRMLQCWNGSEVHAAEQTEEGAQEVSQHDEEKESKEATEQAKPEDPEAAKTESAPAAGEAKSAGDDAKADSEVNPPEAAGGENAVETKEELTMDDALREWWYWAQYSHLVGQLKQHREGQDTNAAESLAKLLHTDPEIRSSLVVSGGLKTLLSTLTSPSFESPAKNAAGCILDESMEEDEVLVDVLYDMASSSGSVWKDLETVLLNESSEDAAGHICSIMTRLYTSSRKEELPCINDQALANCLSSSNKTVVVRACYLLHALCDSNISSIHLPNLVGTEENQHLLPSIVARLLNDIHKSHATRSENNTISEDLQIFEEELEILSALSRFISLSSVNSSGRNAWENVGAASPLLGLSATYQDILEGATAAMNANNAEEDDIPVTFLLCAATTVLHALSQLVLTVSMRKSVGSNSQNIMKCLEWVAAVTNLTEIDPLVSSIAENACLLLANLSFNDNDNKELIFASGGFGTLLGCLSVPSEECTIQALTCLSNLSSNNMIRRAIKRENDKIISTARQVEKGVQWSSFAFSEGNTWQSVQLENIHQSGELDVFGTPRSGRTTDRSHHSTSRIDHPTQPGPAFDEAGGYRGTATQPDNSTKLDSEMLESLARQGDKVEEELVTPRNIATSQTWASRVGQSLTHRRLIESRSLRTARSRLSTRGSNVENSEWGNATSHQISRGSTATELSRQFGALYNSLPPSQEFCNSRPKTAMFAPNPQPPVYLGRHEPHKRNATAQPDANVIAGGLSTRNVTPTLSTLPQRFHPLIGLTAAENPRICSLAQRTSVNLLFSK